MLTIVFRKIDYFLNHPRYALPIIIVSSFFIKLIIALFNGFNVDAGSYMYDSYLLKEGYIPFKDYTTRSPFFLILLMCSMNIFGIGLFAGRILIILFSTITIFLIYKIAILLYDKKIGVLSCMIYAISPIFIWWGFAIKTDPVENVMVLSALYLLLLGISENKISYFIFNGIFLGLAVMIRKSAGIFLITEPIFMFYLIRFDIIRIHRLKLKLTGMVSGFVLAILPFMLFFIHHIGFISTIETFGEISLFGGSSPDFPRKDAINIIRLLILQAYYLIFPTLLFIYLYLRSLINEKHSIELNLVFAFLGSLFIVAILGIDIVTIVFLTVVFISFYFYGNNDEENDFSSHRIFMITIVISLLIALEQNPKELNSVIISLGTILLAFLIYQYLIFTNMIRSLYMKYFFFIILTGMVLYLISDQISSTLNFLNIFSVTISAFVFMFFVKNIDEIKVEKPNLQSTFLMFWILSLLIFYLFFPRWLDVYFINMLVPMTLICSIFVIRFFSSLTDLVLKKAFICVIIASLVSTYGFYLTENPDRHWSYDDITEAANYVREHTEENEEVFGSPEVALYAERKIVMNLSHPALYRYGTAESLTAKNYPLIDEIMDYMDKNTIRYIIHTEYTEYCYYTTHENFEDYVSMNYILEKEFNDIRILVRKETVSWIVSSTSGESVSPTVSVSNIGNQLHVAWEDNYINENKIIIASLTNNPNQIWNPCTVSPTIENSVPKTPSICTVNNKSYVVWEKRSFDHSNIFLSIINNSDNSLDKVISITNIKNEDVYSIQPKIKVSDDNFLYIVWAQNNPAEGDYDLYYLKMDIDTNIVINNTKIVGYLGDAINPEFDIDHQNNLHIVWQDGRQGNYQIFYAKLNGSLDEHGNSSSPSRLKLIWDKKISNKTDIAVNPDITIEGNELYVVWEYHLSIEKNVISFCHLNIHGNIVHQEKDVTQERMKINGNNVAISAINPALKIVKGKVVVVWQDDRQNKDYENRYFNIYLKLLNLKGEQLNKEIRISHYESMSINPDIAIEGDTAHIVWADNLGGDYEIFYIGIT